MREKERESEWERKREREREWERKREWEREISDFVYSSLCHGDKPPREIMHYNINIPSQHLVFYMDNKSPDYPDDMESPLMIL